MDGLDLLTAAVLVRALEMEASEKTVATMLNVIYEVWGKHTHHAIESLAYRLTDDEVRGWSARPDVVEVMRRAVHDR